MVALVLLAALGIADSAQAGTYRVVACDGAPGAANRAWTAQAARGTMAETRCPTRGDERRGLVVRNRVGRGTVRSGRGASMTFRAPAGAGLARIHYDWDGRRVGGGWTLGLAGRQGRLLAGCRAGEPSSTAWCRLGRPGGSRRLTTGLNDRSMVRIVATCGASAGCRTDGRSRAEDPVRARLAVHSAAVEVRDGTEPSLDGTDGDLLARGWQRGSRTAVVRAADNVGVRTTELEVPGVRRSVDRNACDYTRPAPCPRAVAHTHRLDTRELADGHRVIALIALDTAGNRTRLERTIQVDNHAPAPVSGVRVIGGEGTRSTNSFDVRWTAPPGQAAPIAKAHYRLCRVGSPGRCVEASRQGGAGGLDDLSVPGRGDWRFSVWLEDEAGNAERANASAPVTLRFDDRLPAHVVAGVESRDGPRSHLTVPFGTRPTISGTVTGADGTPVGGGSVTVTERIRGRTEFRRVGAVTVDGRGAFAYRAASGPSRTLRLGFRGSERYRPAEARVRLSVRARSSLRVSRHRVRNGDRVRFKGRLLGGRVPARGKLVQLQARYRNRWRTFALVRSNRRGAWRYPYRFGGTRGRFTYPFRVRIPRERGYPYAVGHSRTVRVTVDGR
ncbi:MAG TPA: hypothetical protein VGR10_03345 [Thermoleophilaceae bacterium]|nr:hypothetical protein [Thermoleophilaceae bacterium]